MKISYIIFSFALFFAKNTTWAQISEQAISVPVKLQIVARTYGSHGPGSGSINASLGPLIATISKTDYEISTGVKTALLEVGRPYNLVINTTGTGNKRVYLTPPPGYLLTVDGVAKNLFGYDSSAAVFNIRVFLPEDALAKPAGTASPITGGQIKWEVSLGSLLNGRPAGSLSIIGAATSAWTSFFTPQTLYYESQSSEIYVHRINGNIRQVSANEAFLDVVTLDNTSYELRFYAPSSATGSTYPKTLAGLPFVIYRVAQDGGSTKLRITKETRSLISATDTTTPIARTEWTTIQRTGSYPAFTWTVADWTLAGESAMSREVRTWTGNTSNGHDETIQIREPNNTPVAQVTRSHTGFAWGHTPTNIVAGTTTPTASDISYNTDSSNEASYGFVRSVQSTGGTWVAYDYFPTTDDLKLGTISTTYAPFLDSPSSVTMSAGSGVITSMAYAADPFGMLRRLTSSETRVNNTLTAKTTITYSTSIVNGMSVVTATRQDQSNSTGALLTSLIYSYQEDTADAFFRNQPHGVVNPDRTAQSFIRQLGTWNGTTFTPSASGTASRIGTISGIADNSAGTQLISAYAGYTVQSIYLVPNKSTLDLVIRDNRARVARTESHVWDGSAWQLVNWTNSTYNWNNQLTQHTTSNGDTYDAAYLGELKLWERDGAGIKTSYTYDTAGRIKTATKEGANGLPDLITESTYDAADRVIQQETYAASGSTERLTTIRSYDLAGRPLSETAPGVGVTTYSYDPVNRSQTVTTPDLSTRTQTSYIDGQSASETGTGSVSQYFTYGIESDGRRWSRIRLASAGSARWTRTWTDWLGRNVRIERPGFTGQPNYVEQNTYHTTNGQLLKTSRTDTADTLYTYNIFGQLALSGLDLNANGTLDLASIDRITGGEKWFANESGAWWLASRTYTYATLNSATETTTETSRERLTGFTGNLRSEIRGTDAEGNTATSTVAVARATRTVTKTTQTPGLSAPQVEVSVNGLGTTVTTPDGLVFTTGYDVLQRPVTSSNTRAGVTRTATTAYELGTVRPATLTDPSGTVTATYAYDIMGRKSSVKNADNKYTRFSYTPRGELARQWGESAPPIALGYNSYGERTSLKTYRTDGVWSGDTWPASPPSSSTTTWTFDSPSGLLTKKTDAASAYVEYDYNARGQVLHRYWARTLDGTAGTDRVTATYDYDPQTAAPVSITYNDGTPAVTSSYTRLGQVASITDFTGTRTFAYDPSSPWRLSSDTLSAFYQGNIFKPLYETTTNNTTGTLKGRSRGFQLGTVATPSALLQQTYTVNALGRLTGISSSHTNGASSQAFAYTYLAGSRLLQSIAATGTAFTTTRSYEPDRDLLTSIKGQWSTVTKSEFTYTHDTFGRRSTATQAGDAFADYGDATHQQFTYNDRSELTAATGYLGVADPANKLPGRQFQFSYDAAGNRTKANHTGISARADTFTVNTLNQLTTRQNKAVSVSGTAAEDATIAVDNQLATRKGRYWQLELLQDTTAIPLARSFATIAAKAGGGTGGTDIAQIDRRNIWLPGYTETLDYDADGNLVSDATWTYTWDAENRLIAMEGRTWTTIPNGPQRQRLEFRYDSRGRRVLKRSLTEASIPATWSLVGETRFLYDGWNLIAEFESSTSTPITLRRTYAWGLDLTSSLNAAGGIGGLLQITDHSTGARHFPTYDGNGNIATLVNAANGNLGASYEYNAFGEPLRAVGSYAKANPFRFSTKFTDNETGLIYYGHRYYDAHNGRFINRDPIEERGGMNLYGFCGNDGVNQWDYLGQSWLSKAWKKVTKWVSKNKWAGMVAGAVAGFFTGGSTWAAMGSWATANTIAAGAIAGAAGGFTAGVTTATLMGSNFGQVMTAGALGGAVGAITGGILAKFRPSRTLSFNEAAKNAINNGTKYAAAGEAFQQTYALPTLTITASHTSSNAVANFMSSGTASATGLLYGWHSRTHSLELYGKDWITLRPFTVYENSRNTTATNEWRAIVNSFIETGLSDSLRYGSKALPAVAAAGVALPAAAIAAGPTVTATGSAIYNGLTGGYITTIGSTELAYAATAGPAAGGVIKLGGHFGFPQSLNGVANLAAKVSNSTMLNPTFWNRSIEIAGGWLPGGPPPGSAVDFYANMAAWANSKFLDGAIPNAQ